MTAQQMLELALNMSRQRRARRMIARNLKADIDAATTIDAVNAIDIVIPWPGKDP